ncbi:MAG TPA: ribulose-phosphate 3-epimerase [Acidobacteriota bacterium]|jgi:ribulose-phosphate 3-epimerase|nr:ribulose-phosphate 3-epimerase [Acidobacteriota bacterium]HJN48414.1 ribulose-phosphate 3-epimerase [Acidobacteriota bacterium]|tara:strand:- start:11282 stop:11959 length:678 start_codon:yes stop_codon:yes gene_type:complete
MSPMRNIQLAPSLLAADFADLRGAVKLLDDAVDIFHIDIMDGDFVPNITMGPMIVAALRQHTDAVFDVHLMVRNPDVWIGPYRDAGADWISVHYETAPHLERTLSCIRESGARAGIALNPGTYPDGLEYVLNDTDFVLVMSVNPGFGGQNFLVSSLKKLSALRTRLDEKGLSLVQLEIDGGVDATNASDIVRAGADILVAGSSVYRSEDPLQAVEQLLANARAGL